MSNTSESEKTNRPVVNGFSCNLLLRFNPIIHGKISDFMGVGYGKSKKEAKFMATERLVIDLI